MANSPSVENVQRGLRVRRELDAMVTHRFKIDKKMTITDCYILALEHATLGVELPPETLIKIARDKREAAKKKGGVK